MSTTHDETMDTADILIVDDESANLKLLSEILVREGFRVRPANSPKLAIDSALGKPPDLILLDIRMPDMDGFEVCAILKQDERTNDVPILFISALQDTKDKVRAFEAGGVDFITKPFQEEEVLARVRTHLNLRNMQRNLEKLVAERTAELATSERLARTLLNATTDITHLIDEDGIILDLNEAVTSRVGRTRAELLGTCIFDLFPEEVAKSRKKILRQALSQGKPIQYTDRHNPDVVYDTGIYPIETPGREKGQVVIFAHDITEREKILQAVNESDRQLREAQRLSHIGSWQWDVESDTATWSDELYAITSRNSNLPAPSYAEHASLWTKESWELLQNAVEKAIRFGEPYDLELDILRPDGELRHVFVKGAASRDQTGRITQLSGTAQDITERKRAEQALIESERRFSSLFQNAAIGIALLDEKGYPIVSNPALVRLLGYSAEELGRMTFAEFTHPDDVDTDLAFFNDLVEGRRNHYQIEKLFVTKEGGTVWVQITASIVAGEDGGRGLVIKMVENISSRKQAEVALRQSETKFRRLVENVPDVIWTSDLEGNTVYISENVQEVFGFSQEEIYENPHHWMDRIHPDDIDHLNRSYARLFETGEVFDVEYRTRHKDGHWIWLHDRSMSFYHKDGAPYADGLFTDISRRKKAELALQKSRDYLQYVINAIPDAVFSVKLPERIIEWAKDSYNVLGVNLSDLIGKTTRQLYYSPEEYETFGRLTQNAILNDEDSFIAEGTLRKDSGETFEAEISATIYRDKNGPVSALALVRDISRRKKAQEALEKSETRLKEAQRIAQIGNWELDLVTNTLTWSDEIFRIFEISQEQFGADYDAFLGLIHPDDRNRVDHAYTQSLGNRQPYGIDHRLLMPDGRIKYVHEQCESLYSPDGKPLRSFGTVQDITERKELEGTLKDSEEKLLTAQKIARLGYWEWDLKTDQVSWSDEMYRIYGIAPGTSSNFEATMEMVHPDDREYRRQILDELTHKKTILSYSHRILRPDGSVGYLYGMGVSETDEQGDVFRLKGTLQDVTELKTVKMAYRDSEARLKKAQAETMNLRLEMAHLNRIMTMNELAASFAHEINQPLGAIVNNASAARILLDRPEDEREDFGEILEDITADAYRAGQIIRKIRGVMTKGDAVYAALDLNMMLDEVLALYQNSFSLDRVSVSIERDPDLVPVKGDTVRLQQVLMNLITNAVDAMAESPQKALAFRTFQTEGMACVSVKDTGPGIEEGQVEKIFDPFYSTKPDGMGIGLRLCRSIIQEHGGRIWAENSPHGGTTFYFTLKTFSTGENS